MKKKFDLSNHLPFKGSFSGLKKEGFKFQKLFANNYMQWCFNNGEEYGPHAIRVWKHLGGYVEIDDFYYLSKFIARLFCTPELLESTAFNRSLQMKSWTMYHFIIDRESGEITRFDKMLHDSWYVFKSQLDESPDSEELHVEISKWHDEFSMKYREARFSGSCWLIPKIRDMYAKGMIDPFC